MSDTSGQFLFASAANGEVFFWSLDSKNKDLRKQRELLVFQGSPSGDSEPDSVASLSWNDDNTALVVAPVNGKALACVNIGGSDITITHSLHQNGGMFTCACYLGNGQQLLFGSSDGSLTLVTQDSSKTFTGHTSAVTCVCRNKSRTMIVSGSENGTILLHRALVSSTRPVILCQGQGTERISSVAFSQYETGMVASCGSSGTVKLWSVDSQRLLTTFTPSHSDEAYNLAFSTYNRLLLTSVGADRTIKLYDIVQRKQVSQISSPVSLCSIMLTSDGNRLIGGGSDGKLYMYNLHNCKTPERVMDAHSSPVTALAAQTSSKNISPPKKKTKSRKLPQRGDSGMSSSSMPSLLQDHTNQQTPLIKVASTKPTGPAPLSFQTPALPVTRESLGIFSPLDVPNGTPDVVSSFVTERSHTRPQPTSAFSSSTTAQQPSSAQVSSVFTPPLSTPLHSQPSPTASVSTSSPLTNMESSSTGLFSPLDASRLVMRSAQKPTTLVAPSQLPHSSTAPMQLTTISSTITTNATPATTTASSNPSSLPVAAKQQSSYSESTLREQPPSHAPDQSTLMGAGNSSHFSAARLVPETQSTPLNQEPTSHQYTLRPLPGQNASSGSVLPGPLIQYLDTLMKDCHEELWSEFHRDVRHLRADLFRQLFIQQNQIVTALSTLAEKIDNLQADVDEMKLNQEHMMPRY